MISKQDILDRATEWQLRPTKGFRLTGGDVDGAIRIKGFRELPVYRPSYGIPKFQVGLAEANRAFALAKKLRLINETEDQWLRLRWGLKVLFQGSQGMEGGDRLHGFVRALEALIKPEIGKTRGQFAHRAQIFAIASSDTREALLQMFDIRSHVEHLHSPLDALSGTGAEKTAQARRRLRQADILSRLTFAHVLESEEMLEIFRTDSNIEAFWSKQDDKRACIWQNRCDLSAFQ